MRAWLAPLPLLTALVGCGDPLVGGDFRPPYFTIEARANPAPMTTLPKNINVALLWFNDQGMGQNFATEVVSFSGVDFPITWQLDVHALPPAAAIHAVPVIDGVDPSLRFAYGTLVAYADNDGNQRLTIDPSDGTRSPDVVLGALPLVDVYYLAAGRPAPAPFVGILPTAPGFSLVQQPPRVDPAIGECDEFNLHGHLQSLCEQEPDGMPALLPAAPTIDFTLTADPSLQRYACASFWGPNEYADWWRGPSDQICDGPECTYCRGYNCPLDVPPPDVKVECSADGLEYRYKKCSNDASRCGTTFCHYGHGARLATDPVPAGWPCP